MRILHISDLHFGYEGKSKTLADSRQNCLDSLLCKVAEIANHQRIDYLVVSGDVANSGNESEYIQACEFFSHLMERGGIEPSKTIICPGNHDFNRRTGAAFSTPSDLEDAQKTYNLESLPTISVPFQSFETFCKKMCFACPQLTSDTQTYLVGVCSFPDINFVVLNSAWQKKDGSSWVSKSFLENIMAAHLIKPGLPTVTVMHHPMDALQPFEHKTYGAKPTFDLIEQFSDLVLCGHSHETEIKACNTRTGTGYSIACGASYESKGYKNCFVCYDLEDDKFMVQPFYYQGDEWKTANMQRYTWKLASSEEKQTPSPAITAKKLHVELCNYGFRIAQCKPEHINKGGILIWPVVPRKEITIIHQAEIEIMGLMCKLYPWKVFTLISDCGTKTKNLDSRDICSFKKAIDELMQKRGVVVEKSEHLSRYFCTNDHDRSSDILSNFIRLSEEMKQKELAKLKNKEYRQDVKNSNEELPVIDYILPLLQLSVVLYLSNKEYSDRKVLVVAGRDEVNQWEYICHKNSSLGSLLIPTLMDDKQTGCWQQGIDKYLSAEQICDDLEHGNFGFWCYTMFVYLQRLLGEDNSQNVIIDSSLISEWQRNQFTVPKEIDLKQLSLNIWKVASLAISD